MLFRSNRSPTVNHDNQKNLLIYCQPTSVTEYLSGNTEAALVRSTLLKNNRTVVAIFDPVSASFVGGSQADILAAMTGDMIAHAALCAAAFQVLSQLDQLAATQLCGQRQDVVIVVGSGGREHAMAVALAESPLVAKVICCPGNGGTAVEGGKISNAPGGQENETVAALVKQVGAHMVVVGPEGPLVDGLVDHLAETCPDVMVFGPSKAAAELEASKVCQRSNMSRIQISGSVCLQTYQYRCVVII